MFYDRILSVYPFMARSPKELRRRKKQVKKLKKRLLVFLLTMAMCCPLILEPLSVLADGDENAATVETEEILQEQGGAEGSPIISAPEFAEGLIYAEAPQRYLTAGDSFTAEPKQERFTVNSNERVTLEVITSAPAGTTLSYQWQKYHQEENGDWEPTALEGETSSTYQTEPITQYTMYNCIVRDSESHEEYVFFYITRQNHFRADAVESRVIIERGQSATIAVVASGDELDGVTYKWDHGPTTASCVVSEPGNYYCTVKDKFLNSYGVSVRVGYENHFSAWAEESRVFVAKGGNATLKVNASGDDLTGVTYAWSQRLLVEGSTNNYRYVTLQGETGNTLPVSNITERGEYYCDVKDAYGNYSYIQFVVGINNHLSVKTNQSQVSVNYGGTATLKAIATADEMDGLTYRWTRNDNTGYVFNEVTGNTFTTGAITEFESYCCTVTDKYGNIGEAYFSISVNNHFQASAETNPIKISKGGKATLKVTVSGDDITGVTYRWREVFVSQDGAGNYFTSSIPIQDATQSSYQTDALNEPKQFQCIATDRFGSDSYVNFQVVFENHFTARAEKQEQSVSPGGKATLSVNVTGDDLSKVTYRWEELVKETNGGTFTYTRRGIPNETASSLNTGAISDRKEYYCVANDGYGSEISVWFIVDIENHFSAKAVKSKVTVASGENAELEVSCSGDDLTGITYAWYLQHDNAMPELLEGVTSSKLILRNITQAASYRCIAQDKYGKSSYVWFTVGIENHLTLKAEKRNYYVNPGGSVELSVNASADNMTQLTYQ